MFKKFLPIALVFVLTSCDKKFNDVGAEVLPPNSFQAKKITYPVSISHAVINAVQTNNPAVLHLGKRQDNLFGTTNAGIVSQLSLSTYAPFFGVKTAQEETQDSFDEQETVTDVWLEIPFFTNQNDADGDGLIDIYDIDDNDPNSDSDGDGISDSVELNNGTDPTNPDTDGDGIPDGQDTETVHPNPDKMLYAVDSLFGQREASFDVEVHKLSYFLRQLDPNLNFEQNQAYYSDFDINANKELSLANEEIQLNLEEIVIDDATNLSPRLRVPLNNDTFQQMLINKEGQVELSSIEDWQNYFRSISIQTSGFSAPLLMLFDLSRMAIRISYTYKAEIEDDAGTVTISDVQNDFLINAGIIRFNTIEKETAPSAALNAIVSSDDAEQIALGGGLGSVATASLFEDTEVLEALKGKPWLLNEANLTFHVDQQAVEQYNLSIPERIYVYNGMTDAPLIDFAQDASASTSLSKLVYGGYLTEEDESKYYKIRITDHLRNIISNDSINAPLRISLSNAFNTQATVPMAQVKDSEVDKVPSGAVAAPKSVVFIGPNPSDPALADLKLELEVYYTEIE